MGQLVHLLPVHHDLPVLEQPHCMASVLHRQALGTGGRMVLEAVAAGQGCNLPAAHWKILFLGKQSRFLRIFRVDTEAGSFL
jgi:hypothetical protein